MQDRCVLMRVVVMLDHVTAWTARMRSENRNQAGYDGTEQR